MLSGSLGTISTLADWNDALLLLDEDTGDPIDLTGAVVTLRVQDRDRCCCLSGGTATGEITIPDLGAIVWNFTAPVRLPEGEHDVGILITLNGVTVQLFLGNVCVERGI